MTGSSGRPIASDEGAVPEETADTGDLLMHVDGVEVRESMWAGAYYCAHVLWVTSQWADGPAASVARDRHGDPLVGFLHVPADPEATGAAEALRPREQRHARTVRVLAAAFRGILDELRGRSEQRVLVTGFGPFAAIVSNPTGDLVGDDDLMADALALAAGSRPRPAPVIEGGGRLLRVHEVDSVRLGRLLLDVDDSALDQGRAGSLPWALQRFAPHAVLALGVHRGSSMFRVELEPTTAGLSLDGTSPRHERGRPIDARAPVNRALARAIARGAAKLSNT